MNTWLLLAIISLGGCQIIAQECSTPVCPRSIPIRSDGKSAEGICNIPEAVSTRYITCIIFISYKAIYCFLFRNAIENEVSATFSSQSPPIMSAFIERYLGMHPDALAGSCSNIYRTNPAAQNGYYYLRGNTPSYCRFDLNTEGDFDEYGWERFVLVDMREANATCPGDFRRVVGPDNVAYCRRNINTGGCTHMYWPTYNYVKRMYGRIYGIQFGTPDIERLFDGLDNDGYVDGVSLTYSRFPNREHIWTFIGYTSAAFPNCPCSTEPARETPTFIGDNYFCESGTDHETDFYEEFTDDPIWDAMNCEATQVNCCDRGPWFYREFNTAFLDEVELRLCLDQDTSDEDIGLQLIELWVQE